MKWFLILALSLAPTDTDTSGDIDEIIDTRKYTPVTITSVPSQSWTQNSAITSVDMTDYLDCGRATESFITHNWSASGLPAGVSINSTTGVISGTPTTSGALSVTVTCDNQCTGDGCPSDTDGTIAMSGTITAEATGGTVSADYYVNLDGASGTDCDDTWAGTLPEPNGGPTNGPWCTWSKVSATVSGGDEVAFLTGTSETAGEFAVSVNGTSGDRTIMRTYCLDSGTPKEWTSGGTGCSGRAELIGNDTDDNVMKISGDHFSLISMELSRTDHVGDGSAIATLYVTGDNFLIDDYYDEGWTSKSLAVAAVNASKQTIGILVESSIVGVIQDSTIRNHWQNVKIQEAATYIKVKDSDLRTAAGDSLRFHGKCGTTERHLVSGNQMGDVYTSDAYQTNRDFGDAAGNTCASHAVVRNNTIIGSGVEENGIDPKGSEYLLVEGNVIAGFPGDNEGPNEGNLRCYGASAATGAALAGPMIYRRNQVYDNCGGILSGTQRAVYNNTLVGNNRDYSGPNTTFTRGGEPYISELRASVVDSAASGNGDLPSVIRNNIACYNNVSDASIENINNSADGVDFDFNLYCPGFVNATDTNSSQPTYYTTLQSWKNAVVAITGNDTAIDGYPGNDNNAIVGDPNFVDGSTDPLYTGSYDWTPQAVALGAGGHLTRATNVGTSGTTLTVDRADVFYDAWICDSAPSTYTCEDEADTIVIGVGGTPVQISSIDYTTNTITLSAARSWTNNDPIYWEKVNPDIGAIEVE